MDCNVVLVEPAIPQNTGNIARLTAALCCKLHIVEPMGFRIDEKTVRRAGLDYWPEVNLEIYASWQEFLKATGAQENQLWLFSTKAPRSCTEVSYSAGDYLVFGSEPKGLSSWFHEMYPERRVVIPIENPKVRSFNLANAVAIGLFEARRSILA